MPKQNSKIECSTSSSLMSDIHSNKNSINNNNKTKNKRSYSGDNTITNNGRSKIPVYNGNNHSDNGRNCMNVLTINKLFEWNIGYHHHQHHHYQQQHQQPQRLITNLNNLRIMDLPEHVRIHQDLHNRLNHPQRHHCQPQQQQRYCQHKLR